jgi:hypothetical protein
MARSAKTTSKRAPAEKTEDRFRFYSKFHARFASVEGYRDMESAHILLILVGTLALFCTAAALPRGLLAVAFFALVATVAVVVMLEVAPTSQTGSSQAVVIDHVKPRGPVAQAVPN